MKKPLQVFNFSVINKGNSTLEVSIDGQIVDASTQQILKEWFGDTTSVSYKSFRDQLAKETFNTLNVYINSPGGIVTDAMAIHDLLVDYQNKGVEVNTIGRGLIASSATLILLASNKPQMSANSMFMIHTVSGGMWGNVDEIESYAASMRKFNNMIVDLYAERTNLTKDEINAMMVKETWLTAKEAEEQKFIWKKIDNASFSNIYNEAEWGLDSSILNTYNQFVNHTNIPDMTWFEQFKNDLMNAIKGVPANNNHTEFMNSIGQAMAKPFENFEANMNKSITDTVSAAVKPAVDEAIKPLQQEITDLTGEIATMKGAASQGNKGEGVKPVGSFSN